MRSRPVLPEHRGASRPVPGSSSWWSTCRPRTRCPSCARCSATWILGADAGHPDAAGVGAAGADLPDDHRRADRRRQPGQHPAAIWLPAAANAFNIYLLKRFFDQIPDELLDAAGSTAPGASRTWCGSCCRCPARSSPWSRSSRSSPPGRTSSGRCWFSRTRTMQTLSVALQRFEPDTPDQPDARPAWCIASVPMVVVFLVFQRQHPRPVSPRAASRAERCLTRQDTEVANGADRDTRGGAAPPSTRCTCAASPTATATASGDLAGVRARAALPRRTGHRRDLVQPLVPVADGRRRLRRGGLPRHRAGCSARSPRRRS